MTEYGRSPGSEPWHPEDPLYGHQGWEGQQADGPYYQQHAQQQYGAGQQGAYPQQSPQPQGYGDPQYGAQQGYDTSAQGYPAQNYGGQGGGYGEQQYGEQQYGDQQYGDRQYGGQYGEQQGHGQPQGPAHGQQPQHAQHGQQPQHGHGQQPYDGTWDTGQQAAMPYGATPPPADPYGGQNPDLYGTPEAYPPPQPPGQRRAPAQESEPKPEPDWEAEPPEEEKHPFFTGDDGRADDEDDAYDDDPAENRRGSRDRRGKTKKRKSRNGCACLVVTLVLAGGLGGVGYFGYQFLQGQFGAAPDYEGTGTSETVEVEIPLGAGGAEIGNILLKAGVVKSQGAFIAAQEKNPKGRSIQAGVYLLKKGMSAASAVEAMLNPASQNAFIIPEGKRNAWIYEQIDKRLELKAGTTKGVAKAQADKLGLPEWATGHKNVKDPLEGFLFPAAYPVAKGSKPEDVLKKMVNRANTEYGKLDLEAKAKTLGLDGPWELITVASLVQVEGKYKHDFDKVSRVVYNRLKPNNVETVGRLEFDSTVNYLKGQSTLDVGSVADLRKIKDPYNTYDIKGLTPGPISNPGIQAVKSAMDPTPGPWYYFVSINENKTVFSVTNDEHNRNVAEYEKEREKSGQ
ncbi:endolytic transglycosylase MltG [Streptomyces sp. NPDC047928]|uniref:endolytic transglycosylase MltG n=1 Tax=unclassified Streptomyces TaxID=2593676 RepID=UPI00372005FC